jgi:hypothetical protein
MFAHGSQLHAGHDDFGDYTSIYELQQPERNADTERLMRTLKEELLWLRE